MMSPCSAKKSPISRASAADQGGGDELRKAENGQLLVEIAQTCGPVVHPGTLHFSQRQQMRGGEIVRIDRRVLAHEHCAELVQGGFLRWIGGIPVRTRGNIQFARLGADPAFQAEDFRLLASPYFMAPAVRSPHHRHAGILVMLEAGEGIDDEQQPHAVASSL